LHYDFWWHLLRTTPCSAQSGERRRWSRTDCNPTF
jgi:hypothetical protein